MRSQSGNALRIFEKSLRRRGKLVTVMHWVPKELITKVRNSSLMRMVFGGSILRAASLCITLVGSVALARVLGPAGLGHYSFALAIITVIGLPIHMGLPTLVVRETARSEANHEWSDLSGLWRWAWRRIATFTIMMSFVAIPILLFLGDQVVQDGGLATLWIGLILIPLIAIAQVRGSAARGLHRPILGLLPDAILRPAGLILLLATFWLAGVQVSAKDAMAMHVVAAIAASLLGVLILYRIMPDPLKTAVPSYEKRREWQRAVLPLAMLAGAQVLMQNANILILGWWESPDQVGFFKIAMSASNLAILGLTAVNLVIAPTLVNLITVGDKANLQRKSSQSSIMALFAAMPISIILWLYGVWILELFYGEEFVASYSPMAILLVGQVSNAFFGSCSNLLNMSGNERLSLRVMVFALLLNVALAIALIPPFGVVGAAIASAATVFAWNFAFAVVVWRKLGIRCTPFGLFR